MEKSRNYVVFGVLALVVSLVAVSLAYAGFTATLNINGTANITSAKWHVYFDNTITNKAKSASATWTQEPSVDSETLITWGVNFTTPGDYAEFDFTTLNDGNFDAKLQTITIGTPTCTASGTTSAGVTTANSFVCSNAMTLVVTDLGNSNAVVNATTTGTYILPAVSGTRTYHVRLTYVDNGDSTITPAEAVTVTGLEIQYGYVQDGTYKAS